MKIETAGSMMTAEVESIREVQVIRVQPGDVLALVSEDMLSDRAIESIASAVKPTLPAGVQIVVLERMHFEVLRAEEQA